MMASFDRNADTRHAADFDLLRGGGVAMYRQRGIFNDAQQGLADLGYVITGLAAADWDEASLHDSFAGALQFPSYYGRNLNALADCLYDVAHGDYALSTDATGLAVPVAGFGTFAGRQPDLAAAIANTMVRASSEALLFGHRLVWLLQVDDGRFRLGPLGCVDVPWNRREWLDASRR